MTPSEDLAALLAQAEPLRSLGPDAQEAAGLRQIVDRINALRAAGVELRAQLDAAQAAQHEAEFAAVAASVNRPKPVRKPGRPRKDVEAA